MKKLLCLAAGLLALNLTPVFGQLPGGTIAIANNQQSQPPALTKFNLNFPGGTPKELVAAIEKAMGKPLNVIITEEFADTKLPALKLNEITFPQLNDTLRVGTHKEERFSGGGFRSYGDIFFKTVDNLPSDSTVWFFVVDKQYTSPPVEKVCQFYSLSPYLDRGFTVDDITTAIQTGWKMAGITPTPELSYHKETKMLITFGEPGKLKTIDDVLRTLPAVKTEYIAQMNRNISALAQQVHELQKSVSASATNSAPAEKPGK